MSRPPVRPAALVLALLVDELLGEPPARVHPVVAMGAWLRAADRVVPSGPPVRAVAAGGAAWAGGALLVTAVALAVDRATRRLPWPVAVACEAGLLSTLLSSRLLREEVADVEAALARSPEAGRAQVGRLVSRDTAGLSSVQVREAALGSLAENLSDSVVAPLLAHAVGGLPGAALYRWTNTADAMWGYRTPRRLHAGRVAARADDLANLLPARLTGLLLLGPDRWRRPHLARLRTEARRTPSPNGGWPMGALALRLRVRVGKPGVYDLHPDGRDATADDTADALRLSARVAWSVAAGLSAAGLAAGAVPVVAGIAATRGRDRR